MNSQRFFPTFLSLAILFGTACSKGSGGAGGSNPSPTEIPTPTPTDNDLTLVANAKAGLIPANILGQNSDVTNVLWNLDLPTLVNGVTIEWASDHPEVIAPNGQVKRPTDADVTVTLTATLKKGKYNDSMQIVVTVPMDTSRVIEEALASLEVKRLLGDNHSAAEITSNLNLPTSRGPVAITWTSSDPITVSSNGTVSRPAYPKAAKSLILTATLKLGNETRKKTFQITVLPLPQTDAQKVEEVAQAITQTSIMGVNRNADAITNNMNLSITNTLGVTVTWESSAPAWITPQGVVSRPTYDQQPIPVTLIAQVKLNSAKQVLRFSFRIAPQDITDAEAIAAVKKEFLSIEKLLGQNTASHSIKTLLVLPQGPFANDVAVSWKSSDTTVISHSGRVTRPAYRSGNKSVTLTATLTRRGTTTEDTAEFLFTVLEADPSDQGLVDNALQDLTADTIRKDNPSLAEIRSNLNLIDQLGRITVRWQSNSPAITPSGTVTQPDHREQNAQVTLTAVLTYGNGRAEKTFQATVIKKAPTPDQTLGDYVLTFNPNNLLNRNTSKADIRTDLILPKQAILATGTVRISWSSSDPAISANGTVTRPAFDAQNIRVSLTANFSYPDATPISKIYDFTVIPMEATPEQVLARAMSEVTEKSILALNSDIHQVVSDLNLPQISKDQKVKISWSTTQPSVVSASGKVTRPPYLGNDADVTLTGTFTLLDGTLEPQSWSLKIHVVKTPASDQEKVDDALALITTESLLQGNPSRAQITSNLKMADKYSGISAVWSSDHPAISAAGTVTRPEFTAGNVDVKLTVTLNLAGAKGSKTFDVTVLKKEPTAQQAVDKYAGEFKAVTLLGANKNNSDIQVDLALPDSSADRAIQIRWTSSDAAVIATTGAVTQPEFNQPARDVILTAVFDYQGSTSTRTFTFTVTPKIATAEQLLAVALKGLTIQSLLKNNATASSITMDLNLPQHSNEVTIGWESSADDVISSLGKVNRPAYRAGDKNVTLKATLTIAGVEPAHLTFAFTVQKKSPTVLERVEDALAKVTPDKYLDQNTSVAEIRSNLKLPETLDGVRLSWTSSNGAISKNGTVTQPEWDQANVDVLLTVRAYVLNVSQTKDIALTVMKKDPTPQQFVDKVAADLTMAQLLGQNPNNAQIVNDLSLPTELQGATIAWQSNDATTISATGKVNRPAFKSGPDKVTLTAELSYAGAEATKSFEFTVLAVPPNDLESLTIADEALTADLIKKANTALTQVTSEVFLPGELLGASIIWESSQPDLVAPSGAVTRPAFGPGDQLVTLIAHLTFGTERKDKEFKLTIQEMPGTDEEVLARAANSLTFDQIKSKNTDDQHIIGSLNLITTWKDVSISWYSNNEDFLSNSGWVSRPQRGGNAVDVELTALFKRNGQRASKIFKLVVTAAQVTDLIIGDWKGAFKGPQRFPLGETVLPHAYLIYDDGSSQDITKEAQWTTTGVLQAKLELSSYLFLKANSIGKGSVTAAYNPFPGKSYTVDYTIDSPAPKRLRFLSDLAAYDYDDSADRTMELRQGKSVPVKLEVSLTDKPSVFTDVTSQATIEYSKPGVVTIKDRVLTALKPGKVDIVARYKDAEGREISRKVTVDVPVKGTRTKAEDAELETLYKAAAVAFASGSVEDYYSSGSRSDHSFTLNTVGFPEDCRYLVAKRVKTYEGGWLTSSDDYTYDLDLRDLTSAKDTVKFSSGHWLTLAAAYSARPIPVKNQRTKYFHSGEIMSTENSESFGGPLELPFKFVSGVSPGDVVNINRLIELCRKNPFE